MKIKTQVSTRWLMPQNVKKEGGFFEITDAKEVESKSKTKIDVLCLIGTDQHGAGEFQLALWNILNIQDLVKAYGDESDNWKGKRISLIPNDRKFTVQLS